MFSIVCLSQSVRTVPFVLTLQSNMPKHVTLNHYFSHTSAFFNKFDYVSVPE